MTLPITVHTNPDETVTTTITFDSYQWFVDHPMEQIRLDRPLVLGEEIILAQLERATQFATESFCQPWRRMRSAGLALSCGQRPTYS